MTQPHDSTLFRFEVPGEVEMREIREILRKAPVCTSPKLKDPFSLENVAVVGSLDDVIAKLREILQSDSTENEIEREQWNGDFDYVVEFSDFLPEAVAVKTRLFSPGRPGNILYGRLIYRVGDDKYILWLDD